MRIRTSSAVATLVRCFAALALIVAVMSPLAPVGAQDESAVDPIERIAALVPADAATLITVSTDTESSQWDAAADLLARGGFEELATRAGEDGLNYLGISPANFDPNSSAILGGAVAVAFWGESPDIFGRGAAYIAAADPEAAFRSVVAQLLTEFGDEVVESDIPGGRIATDVDGATAILLINEIVVLTDGAAAQSVIRLVTGAGPALADFDPFATVLDEQEPGSFARAYLNGPALGQDLASLLSEAGLGWQEIALVNVGAALTSTYTSVGMTADEDGFHVRGVHLPAPLIGRALPTRSPSDDPAERVSAEADVFASGTDLGSNPILVQYVNSLIFGVSAGWAPYDPAGPRSLDEADAGLEAVTGIDLRGDVLDQLRGDFAFAMTLNSFERASDIDAVLVSEVADSDAVRDTLNQIVGALRLVVASQDADASFSEIALGDGMLYVLSVADETGAGEIAYSFGLIGDELVLSLGRGYGRLLLPPDGETLAGDPRYQAARAAASDENGPVAYVDVHDLIDVSGLESFEPSDRPPLIMSLDGIQALATVTYARDDLAITDVVLTIADLAAVNADHTATPAAESGDIGAITGGEVVRIDSGDRTVLSVSPTGEFMLIEEGRIACVVPVDGAGAATCTPEFRGADPAHIAWSANGSIVAFTEDSPRMLVDSDVWTINGTTQTVLNLTEDGFDGGIPMTEDDREAAGDVAMDIVPIFSPDGEDVIFSRTVWGDDERPTEIYRVSIAGGEPEPIATVSDQPFATWGGVTWLDDQTLLYSNSTANSDDPDAGLWTLDIESGETELVWKSPDEAHQYPLPRSVGSNEIVVVSFPQLRQASSTADGECSHAILHLATGELDPLADAGGSCAQTIGVSQDGRFAIFTAGSGANVAIADIESGDVADVDTTDLLELAAELGEETPVLLGPRFTDFVWTTDDRIFLTITADALVSWQLNGVPEEAAYHPVCTFWYARNDRFA